MVPLRSDTIRLVQNGCSFYGLRSEDPNQHLKDFLKLVDSLDLDGENRERTRLRTINQSPDGKLRDLKVEESWALLEDLALYDNESWNDPWDFAKPVKKIALPQDVPSTSDRRLIELETQVQCLMEAYLAPTQPTRVNKITTLCEICSGPHDTQYCMEKPEQSFVDYASSRTDEAGGTLPSDMVKNPKLGTHPVSFARSYLTMDPQCLTQIHISINAITIHPKQQSNSYYRIEENEEEERGSSENHPDSPTHPIHQFHSMTVPTGRDSKQECKKWNISIHSPTRSELAYHKYLMCGPIPSIFLKNPIIIEGCPSNLKMPCNIGHVKLNPRENMNGEISNFTGRIKGMHVFIGNFTYVVDFMIVEDISSIIDPRLSQVVLGRPFIEISNMTHDLPEGVVRFTNENDEVAYKMPHKIEQYNSLSDLEKEHTKSVYLRNEEDKRRGVDYVMSKILGFYKECLELGPEYVTGLDDEGEVT
ncbi:hypothetical protein Tco_0985872 [Tanacetum coccineum]